MAIDRTVVVGGGIVGLSCALALQRAGRQVLLVDPQGEPRPASFGNAGHIAIEQTAPLASWETIRSVPRRLTLRGGPVGLSPAQIRHWLPFALRLARAASPKRFAAGQAALAGLLAEAMPAWRRLAVHLTQPGLVRERGHIVVWHDPQAAARGIAAWQRAPTGAAQFHVADAHEIAMAGRVMARPPAGALVFENTGQVADLPQTIAAAMETFARAGGEVRKGKVRALAAGQDRPLVHLDDGTQVAPAEVLVAAGVASGSLLTPLGHTVPIIAERGYHLQSAGADWPADMPPIVFEERSMIVTRFRSGVRAAGFVEFGAPDAAPDPRRWERLAYHVRDLRLPFEPEMSRWSGARPTLPDYLPAIGRSAVRGVFYAFGHQHLGLTLGPLTGELVADLMTGAAPQVSLAPFALERFA